jgi:DNA-directed RNA polymerase I subunit RPA1
VDAARIGSNDVFAVLQQYGVEAARATLLAEVRAVFGAYGIAVDARHLSLIADAMTHGGAYRPCSRAGLDSCPSPLLKMSFETATAFLTDATLRGATDTLESPSSRLVLGRVVQLGTGACGLQFDLPRAAALHAARVAAAV